MMGALRDWFGFGSPDAEKRIITSLTGIDRQGANLLQVYGLSDITLPSVTIDSALTVPAVLAAASFLPRSLASLPLIAYRNSSGQSSRISGGIQTLVNEAPNPEWSSYKFRNYFWTQVFTGGRGLAWIERSGATIAGIWPINPALTWISRDGMGRTVYDVDGKLFAAADVIDVPFMMKADGVSHWGPITLGAGAIQLALAMNAYGSRFFAGGGVPPLAMEGPMPTGADAMKRAMADINRAIDSAKENEKPIFPMPPGYKLTQVGYDPSKGQMVEARLFQVQEIARIYGLPPVFLHDLSRATFTNSEQQDLHLVKHLIAQWANALEAEMNLKLFGQRSNGRYVEHNLDGLLRGDFLSRMQAYGQSVQNAVRTPNEIRALENLAPLPNGDDLMIQGATVPLGTQPTSDANKGNAQCKWSVELGLHRLSCGLQMVPRWRRAMLRCSTARQILADIFAR